MVIVLQLSTLPMLILGILLQLDASFCATKDVGPPFELFQLEKPAFWKTKKSAKKRLQNREILVSVLSGEVKKNKEVLQTMTMKGVGRVRNVMAVTKKRMLEFEQLPKLAPDNIREVKPNKGLQQVYVHGVAMRWHAKMLMQLYQEEVKQKEEGKPDVFRLHWKVISGSFLGMTGYFELEEIPLGKDGQRREVEFSMTGFYQSEKLPLPAFLLRFGLETVMKVVAQRMRRYLEKPLVETKKAAAI